MRVTTKDFTERIDGIMKTGLVLEGGALRTIFSTGVCDALLDADVPLPDYTIGVSAGIAYGVSYLSRQSRRNLKLVSAYARDRRYMGMRNLLNPHNRAYFGLKFVYDTIPNELIPFDYDAFAAYPGEVEAVLTNLDTGQAEYWTVPRDDPSNTILQATCAIPLMFPPIEVGGRLYFDGGCSDPVPWRRALQAGCDRVVVVLTRERGYHKRFDSAKSMELAFRKYPAFVETMRHRTDNYNDTRAALFALEEERKIMVIAPDDTLGCARTERNLDVIRALWQEGYFMGRRLAGTVREFWRA